MGMIKGADRDAARAAQAGRVRGARASFVLRRLGSARLLPASLLFAVLTSVTVTTALAGFGAQALPAAAHQRLASRPGTPILISGQIGAATASADTPVIRPSLRSALGTVPFTLASGRWSDQLALPRPHRRGTIPLIQAAVLGGVTAHTELTAGAGGEDGGAAGHAVEYAVLDRAGRVQLPREMIDAHGMKDRVRLEQEPDHIGVWPDRDARP